MKRIFEKLTLAHTNKLIHKLTGAVILLIGLCILLCIRLLTADTHIILVPQYRQTKSLELSTSSFSELYIKEWAEGILLHILTLSPETVDGRIQDVARITASGFQGQLKEQLQEEASRIKRDGVSTVFYPKQTTVNTQTKTIHVEGQFHTWFGRDTQPVVQNKIWVLQWKLGPQNVILLKNLYEEKQPVKGNGA